MDHIKQLLGKRIKELRKKHKYTQEQLAEILEIDQRTLSAIECGTNFPTKNFLKIAKAFDITVMELFNFEHHNLTTEEKRTKICNMVNKLEANDIDIVYKFIKSIL